MVIATTTIATMIPISVVVDMRKCYGKREQNKSLWIRRGNLASKQTRLEIFFLSSRSFWDSYEIVSVACYQKKEMSSKLTIMQRKG